MMYILVTGVSRGLGLEITTQLLADGNKVVGVSRTKSPLVKKLEDKYGDSFLHLCVDLASTDAVENMMKMLTLDNDIQFFAFVNNAAIAYDDLITNLNILDLEEMYRINVFSPMLITKYIIRCFLLHGIKGSIIHISSISVHTGYKGLSFYASTKGALEAFSRNTAREWGVRGVRSNCVVAGFMETDMSASLNSLQREKIFGRTCLKKPTSLTSVSSVVDFLVSEKSNSITGQNIFVDSGTI